MEDNLGGKRKVCVILNPVGGNKTALKTYERVVESMFNAAQIPHELFLTEHQHHAHMLASQIDMEIYGSLMVVGGDGLLHEVINGLLSRSDWQSTKDLPIGIMPCGTSNAVARSIGLSDPVYACYSILRGKKAAFDAMLFEQNGHRFYGHFAFFWGLIADLDLGGDGCRCCGRCRMVFSALYQIFRFKTYHAVIEYLDTETPSIPPSDNQSEMITARYKHMFTQDNPTIKRLPEAAYHSFLATKHAWLDLKVPASRFMISETDAIDVITIPKHVSITRTTLLKAMANDDIASLHDDPERCWHGKDLYNESQHLFAERLLHTIYDSRGQIFLDMPSCGIQSVFLIFRHGHDIRVGAESDRRTDGTAENTGCPAAWDIAELQTYFEQKGIRTLGLFISDAHLMPALAFQRLYTMMGTMGQVGWVVDDIGFLTRLPLPLQMSLNHSAVSSRPPMNILAEIVCELLSLEIIPSADLISRLQDLSCQSLNPRNSIKNLLGLSLMEWSHVERNVELCASVPSFRRGLESLMVEINLEDKKELKELCNALVCDAKTAVRRLAAVFRVLVTLCELFGKGLCETADLLTGLLFIKQRQHSWFDTLARKIRANDDPEELARKLSAFRKSLDLQCPFVKDLLAASDSVLPDCIDVISEWVDRMMPEKWDLVPLYEILLLPLGRSTIKLTSPKICESVQLALTHPEFYLNGTIVKNADTRRPDTSLTYRLASECGRLINTLDWFISFRQVVDPHRKEAESDLILRFLRSAHELQLVGIVVPTKKRKDHYERLVLYHRRY
ncbi:hypothetical protein PSACC_00570 [Paramicrosporidium saccamoebae]|uniref:DAGKc domain-containing protein n=1 Tax=Paramicrosporidium saccamoebae TaxID=1246581 RepID=A0A2H9TPG3_9FUNG|nr:hypothetical protein PSACC_00570 [Paramicrosporidium saccamoebae]